MTTTAEDIMSRELITIRESDTIEVALKTLVNHRITGIPVVDSVGRLIGVLSEYDIIRQICQSEEPDATIFARKIEFTKPAHTIPAGMPLAEVTQKMMDAKYRRLPVVDGDNRLVGIVTRRDLMKVYYYRARLK
jgi:CBS domain-containing protein